MGASPPSFTLPLRLGTRKSPLAMAQARAVHAALCDAHGWEAEAVELVGVSASGDKVQDRALAEIGGKALWTKELDQWLVEGRIHAAVHSAKDVETLRPPALAIAAVLERGDRRDMLIGARSIAALAPGAKVGTSAPRRAAQLLNQRADVQVTVLRGNVARRLAKLEAGEVDATFLAAAGLARLGIEDTGVPLATDAWLPAAGQGAIAIECLADNSAVTELLGAVNHAQSAAELHAERALLAHLKGTCHSPVAAMAQLVKSSGEIDLRAVLFEASGRARVDGAARFALGDAQGPLALAKDLVARASPAILKHFDPDL